MCVTYRVIAYTPTRRNYVDGASMRLDVTKTRDIPKTTFPKHYNLYFPNARRGLLIDGDKEIFVVFVYRTAISEFSG